VVQREPSSPPCHAEPKGAVVFAARVVEASGPVAIDGVKDPVRGTLVVPGARLVTGPGASLVLDLLNGARLTLEASSLALIVPRAQASLLLVGGSLRASLAAQGPQNRAALRIVTQDGSFEAQRSVEAWLRSAGTGTTYAAVLSGALDRERLEPAFGVTQLVAGRAWLADGTAPSVLAAATFEQLRKQAPSKRPAPLAAEALALRARTALMAFGAVGEQLARTRNAEHTALGEQRIARDQAQSQRVRQLQMELVTIAQRAVQLRRELRALFERRMAWVVASAGPTQGQAQLLQLEREYVTALDGATGP
jgi:hypothetical protein